MDFNLYSEKEIAVFNGVISLMEKGINPYSIKVSDIAKEADVGKGTIYDYFNSKEEAIAQAIIYNTKGEMDAIYLRVRKEEGFKNKFYEILRIFTEYVDNNVSTLTTLLSVGGTRKFYEYLSDYECDLAQHIFRINDLFEHLLETGVEERIISRVETPYYRNMAIASAIMGFSQYFRHRKVKDNISLQDAMAASYELLVKALS